MTDEEGPARLNTRVPPLVWFIGAGAAIVLALAALATYGPQPAPRPTRDPLLHSTDMAYAECGEFVKRRLSTPATADFPPNAAEHTRAIDSVHYIVAGPVDYQNVFGATVRANYVCAVTDLGKDWRLDSLNLRPW